MKWFAVLLLSTTFFALAPSWWERALARHRDTVLSPDGCIRLETYAPFWVLPEMLHPVPHPDPEATSQWFTWWQLPAFSRAYVSATGDLIGETVIYDEGNAYPFMDWGDPRNVGSRKLSVGGFEIDLGSRCADATVMATLARAYSQERSERQDANAMEGDAPAESLRRSRWRLHLR